MKKILFSALACVAFAGSSFASSEVVESNPCEISILVYDRDGNLLDALIDHTFPEGGAPCFDHGTSLVNELRGQYPEGVFSISIVG